MKKHLCAVFLLLVFLVSVPCISSAMTEEEGYQYIHDMFASYTDEALKTLLIAVDLELKSRGYSIDLDEISPFASESTQKEVTVPPGTYAVGSDIPAGSYTVVGTGIVTILTVKNSSGVYGAMHSVSSSSQIGKLVIEDGQTIDIVGESLIFKPYQGLGF